MSSSDREVAMLSVTTAPGGEIEVFDHQFNAVARATEHWSGLLPVGLYKVQFRAGGVSNSELIDLAPGGATVDRGVDGWKSAAPTAMAMPSSLVSRSDRQMETGLNAWANASQRARQSPTARALFCFVSSPEVQSRSDLGRSFSITPFEAAEPIDAPLEQSPTEGRNEKEGWAWKSYVDPPPFVRLKFFDGLREVEQTVPTLDGYCTAVFLRYDRSTTARWGISAASTTILMARLSDPIGEHRENHRYADLALRALERGGRPISEERAQSLCIDSALDPLTRLYLSAHLISRWHFSREDKRPLWALEAAIKGLGLLSREASDLPDVRLLLRWAQTQGRAVVGALSGAEVSYPPLLNFSWSVGIQAAVDDPQLIPPNSLATSASLQRAAAGPWFAWRASPGLRPQFSEFSGRTKEDLVALAAAMTRDRVASWNLAADFWKGAERGASPSLTDLEAAVVQSLVEGMQAGERFVGKAEVYGLGASPAENALRHVSASFGLTANTVVSVAESSLKKLDEPGG